MMRFKLIILLLSHIFITCACGQMYAQNIVKEKDSAKNTVLPSKNFKIGALFVCEYRASLTNNVDMSGLHNANGVEAFDGFTLRYIRISGNYQLNDKISASVLANLADFKYNPQTRVLENAFIKYKFNKYAIIYVGQFRPFFGVEDMYPYEVRRSYVWSNQYEEFGKNGWQSFQLGIAATGSLADRGIPLNYYLSVVNGNGKNMTGDNDRNKSLTWRLESRFSKHLKLGINHGITRYDQQAADAYGIDMEADINLAPKWILSMDAEYKIGTNFKEYSQSKATEKVLRNYYMGGIYVTPSIRYNTGFTRVKTFEFSTRYEYFKQLINNGNPRTTVTPFFGLILADDYAAKLSFGMVFDCYSRQVINTKQWNANFFFTQFQFKF